MNTAVVIIIVVGVIFVIAALVLIAKRRGEANKENLRREASETRSRGRATEADRQAVGGRLAHATLWPPSNSGRGRPAPIDGAGPPVARRRPIPTCRTVRRRA
jgi:hypothetical protein